MVCSVPCVSSWKGIEAKRVFSTQKTLVPLLPLLAVGGVRNNFQWNNRYTCDVMVGLIKMNANSSRSVTFDAGSVVDHSFVESSTRFSDIL